MKFIFSLSLFPFALFLTFKFCNRKTLMSEFVLKFKRNIAYWLTLKVSCWKFFPVRLANQETSERESTIDLHVVDNKTSDVFIASIHTLQYIFYFLPFLIYFSPSKFPFRTVSIVKYFLDSYHVYLHGEKKKTWIDCLLSFP